MKQSVQLSAKPTTAELQRALDRLAQQTEPYVVTQNYTFKDTDTVDSLQVDASTGIRTITLPSPTGNRRRRIIKTDASINVVNVVPSINAFINGDVLYALVTQYDYLWVEPTGTSWIIIGTS